MPGAQATRTRRPGDLPHFVRSRHSLIINADSSDLLRPEQAYAQADALRQWDKPTVDGRETGNRPGNTAARTARMGAVLRKPCTTIAINGPQ